MLTILLADDHPLFRDALQLAVQDALRDEQHRIVHAQDLAEALDYMQRDEEVDLALVDLKMPGMGGFSGLIELRNRHPSVPVAVVSATDDRVVVREAMTYGICGYIPKSLGRGQIGQAVRMLLDGESFVPDQALDATGESADDRARLDAANRLASLTPQQLRVLKLVAEGKPNKIIAYELDIGETTVKAHITSILRKLGVYSRTQAVLIAQEHLREEAIPR